MHRRMEGTQMAYPEPIPALEAKEAKEFEKRLSCLTLSAEQKRFYKEARERFKARGTRTMFFDIKALDYLRTH